MKILHVVPSYIPAWRYGGTIRSVHGLCKALVGRGHEVLVFTTNVNGSEDLDVSLGKPVDVDGVQVIYFSSPFRRLYWSPQMASALVKQAAHFDVIHSHSVFLWPTRAAAGIARKKNIPHLISPRGMLVGDLIRRKSKFVKTAWIKLIERRNFRDASGVHMTSDLEAKEAAALGLTLPKVFIVPNGIHPASGTTFPSKLASELSAKRPLVLFLGRLNWKKGLDRLIPAMKGIPGAHLAVVGNDEEGYRRALEALVEREGLRGRVTFADVVGDDEKSALYRSADVFVLPSYSENFGNTVLEAMAEGCPVIVTPEVGLAGEVRASGAGLVSSGEPKKLAEAIRTVLNNPSLRATMGDAGRRAAVERFGWDAVAMQMETAYKKISRSPLKEKKNDET